MPTADPVKNFMFVKESKESYVQKEKIGVKEFNRIHSNRENWSQKQVEEEYKKIILRFSKKSTETRKQQETKTSAANILEKIYK